MSYWMEMHCHCATGSGCGKVPPEEIPSLYKAAGYSGVIITDHFNLRLKTPGDLAEYKERVDRAITGYKIAKAQMLEEFSVLLGAEMSLSTESGSNHYLVYGVDEKFLYESFDMTKMTIRELSDYLHRNNKLIYQAHPFREGGSQADPLLIDGTESFNNPRSNGEDNILAEQWAIDNNLQQISGSDFHEYKSVASGGVCFSEPITTNQELLSVLPKGGFKIKRNYNMR